MSDVGCDARVLGQLLAAQGVLPAFSCPQRMAEFVGQAVDSVPGVAGCAACLPGGSPPRLGDAAACDRCGLWRATDPLVRPGPCAQPPTTDLRIMPLTTPDGPFGFFLVSVSDEARFAPYEPFVRNLVDTLAFGVADQWRRSALAAAHAEVRDHRDHLERIVRARTSALEVANARIEHLNAVLRGVRRVNQIVVREREPAVMAQRVCDCLVESRGFPGAWIGLRGPDGAMVLAGAAGPDGDDALPARRAARSEQLGGLARTARSLEVLPLPDVTPGPDGGPGRGEAAPRPGRAARLEHHGEVFGVLLVAVDGTFADDADTDPLLLEVAEDVGFALHHLAREALRARTESQLQAAQRSQAIARLAGGVAHDFNNVLTVILSYGELLLEDLGEAHPARRNAAEILAAAERAARLTRQLLAFARRQVLQPIVIDLNGVVAGLDRMLRRIIGEDVALVTALAGDLGLVRADLAQLEQVLMNLAVNGRDAMPRGGTLTIRTANVELGEDDGDRPPDARPGPYVLLAVTDTGEGMTPEVLAHAFEPFFTTKSEGKGTGLGLATVLGIVKQSEGTIAVDSEPGAGTRFRVYLPRAEAARPDPVVKADAPRRGGTETVMVVEDDAGVRGATTRILRRAGYTVIECAAAGDALLLVERPIHLLLTDMVMPQMSGRELAERVHSVRPELPVLFMSGYAAPAIDDHCVLPAGTWFVEKPFTEDKLLARVRAALDAAAATTV